VPLAGSARGRVLRTRCRALLDDVSQLVCEQLASRVGVRIILIVTEDDIAAPRIGVRSDSARGGIRRPTGMDPYTAEVCPEAGLKKRPLFPRQRLPAAEGIDLSFGPVRRATTVGTRERGRRLPLQILLLALGAETLNKRRRELLPESASEALDYRRADVDAARRLHPHHLFGNVICLLLVLVSRVANRVLRL
jgi:hypothetical protein